MPHTYHQNLAHIVFRMNHVTLREEDVKRLHAYLQGILQSHDVRYICIGGTEDHVHILGDFPLTRAASDIMRGLKASSSYWLKGKHGCYRDFAWQTGYGYFSVSASAYHRVAEYIAHQCEHHAHMSADEEYAQLMEKHSRCLEPPLP